MSCRSSCVTCVYWGVIRHDSFAVPDEDDILKMTMGVVKTVKELSDKVHKSKPNDYVELVKVRREGGREGTNCHVKCVFIVAVCCCTECGVGFERPFGESGPNTK